MADLAFTHAEAGNLDLARGLVAEAEELCDRMEVVDVRAYVLLVAGEIRLACGDLEGASERMGDALGLTVATDNEPFMLRALRLHAQILIEQGATDEGLAILAFVVPRASRQADFTSEIINPRVWAARTAGLDLALIRRAEARASGFRLEDLARSVLVGGTIPTKGPSTDARDCRHHVRELGRGHAGARWTGRGR